MDFLSEKCCQAGPRNLMLSSGEGLVHCGGIFNTFSGMESEGSYRVQVSYRTWDSALLNETWDSLLLHINPLPSVNKNTQPPPPPVKAILVSLAFLHSLLREGNWPQEVEGPVWSRQAKEAHQQWLKAAEGTCVGRGTRPRLVGERPLAKPASSWVTWVSGFQGSGYLTAAGISLLPPSHLLSLPCGSLPALNWEGLLWNLINAPNLRTPISRRQGKLPQPWTEQAGLGFCWG